MIIYGSRSSVKDGQKVVGSSCSNCQQAELYGGKLFPYIHIYWIPFIPLPSKTLTVCGNCKAIAEGKQIPQTALSSVKHSVQTLKRPITHFSGLLFIALAILIGSAVAAWDGKKTSEYASAPQAGDVYILDLGKIEELSSMVIEEKGKKYRYIRARVTHVEDATGDVEFELSNMAFQSASQAKDKASEYVPEDKISLDPKRIIELVGSGGVDQIIR